MAGLTALLHNPEAFSQLYTKSHLIIFRYVYGLLGGPTPEAEDIAAETYLRAWKHRWRFRGDEQDALRWLLTIARHLVIDYQRRKKVHKQVYTDQDDEDIERYFIAQDISPEEQCVTLEQLKIVWQLMQTLPTERREMIVLRYQLGWQVKTIAEHLKMPENTVTVYLQRSLAQIRRDWPEA